MSTTTSHTGAEIAAGINPNTPIESVYPEVAAFYKANRSLEYYPSALDRTHRIFMTATEGNPITKRIDAIYRIKNMDKTYVYYYEAWFANDFLGNEVNWGWVRGKVDKPVAHYEFIPEEGQVLPTSIDHFDTQFNIELTEEVKKDIQSRVHNRTGYCVVTSADKVYSVTSDVFWNDTIEEAIEFGKTGRRVKDSEKKGAV